MSKLDKASLFLLIVSAGLFFCGIAMGNTIATFVGTILLIGSGFSFII